MNRILTTFCLCFVITVVTLAQGYKDVTGQYIKNPNLESEEGWTYSRVNTSGETLTWSAVSKSYSGSFVSEIYAGDEITFAISGANTEERAINMPQYNPQTI